MRVILDGSEVYERWGSSYRYFQALIPRLSQFPDVRVDLIPSPANVFEPAAPSQVSTGAPSAPKASSNWLPRGKLRAWLGKKKKTLAKARYLRRTATDEPTLFHSYYYALPPTSRLPMVSVYLDTIPELFRHQFDASNYDSLIRLKEQTVRRSARVLAISETTKDDLCKLYNLPRDLVDVVYFGIDVEFFSQAPEPGALEAFRQKHELPEHFLFYLGARSDHKNFTGWAKAYASFAGRKDYAFVAAGMPLVPAEADLLKKLGIKAHFMSVPDEAGLRALYKLSDLFVYPSLYEGMGLPPLEAMAAGATVVTARAGAIPEVSGEGAEYFDPRDEASIHAALERSLRPERKAELLRLGRANVSKYTWDSAAEKTVAAYRKVLS